MTNTPAPGHRTEWCVCAPRSVYDRRDPACPRCGGTGRLTRPRTETEAAEDAAALARALRMGADQDASWLE